MKLNLINTYPFNIIISPELLDASIITNPNRGEKAMEIIILTLVTYYPLILNLIKILKITRKIRV